MERSPSVDSVDASSARRSLTPEAIKILEGISCISGPKGPTGNRRTISMAGLFPPSPRSASASSAPTDLITIESFETNKAVKIHQEVDVPLIIESLDTLAFVGFNDATASRLWEMNLRASKDKEMYEGFWAVADMWLNDWFPETGEDVQDDDDEEWFACMTRLGVREDLQRLIMLPEHSDVRLTSSCKGWIREIMAENFKSLDFIEEQVRTADKLRSTASGTGAPAAGPSSSLSLSISQPSSFPSSSAKGPAASIPPDSPNKASGKQAIPAVAETTGGPRVMQGHTMLWRGGTRQCAESFYNSNTGALALSELHNSKPADFSSNPRVYWTPQKEMADKFAGFYKQTCTLDQIAIIQVAVPSDWIESLQKAYLGNHPGPTGDIWRNLVFSSRRKVRIPKEIRHLDATSLLIGDIASGTSQRYTQMTHYSQIKPRHGLRVKVGEEWVNGIQWVFQGLVRDDDFEEKCHRKVWVHAFGNPTG